MSLRAGKIVFDNRSRRTTTGVLSFGSFIYGALVPQSFLGRLSWGFPGVAFRVA
ncbi:hypothetical protein ACRALDRAFT_213800 [Sodiomyces alcalophilus JCM 7366]|uniref:uncharacterized protein n=1 Tax=Sodiomyces alcalophilus JCM 7366 TaxID=591952 RepID=UPI0039B5A16E